MAAHSWINRERLFQKRARERSDCRCRWLQHCLPAHVAAALNTIVPASNSSRAHCLRTQCPCLGIIESFPNRAYTRDGYSMTRRVAPMAAGGRLERKVARTAPLVPCARVTLPHTTRNLVSFLSVLACTQMSPGRCSKASTNESRGNHNNKARIPSLTGFSPCRCRQPSCRGRTRCQPCC